MWLINQWYSQNIGSETEFLYVVLEEEIYMNISEGMAELIEEKYAYNNILALINCIYGLIQEKLNWFK